MDTGEDLGAAVGFFPIVNGAGSSLLVGQGLNGHMGEKEGGRDREERA